MIRLFHVNKRYARDALALDDVSLHIEKGDFVFLTGPSGSGKTTLFKLLFCAERPTSGQILVADFNLQSLRRSSIPYLRRNIGVVFQDFKLLMRKTVYENVAFALEVLGRPRSEIASKVVSVLQRVGLGDKMHMAPWRLSGGEQQRVALARALVNEPAILLADEPTGNLDPELSLEMMRLISDANLRGTTVLVATHDPSLIQAFPRRVLTLKQGKLAGDTGEKFNRIA